MVQRIPGLLLFGGSVPGLPRGRAGGEIAAVAAAFLILLLAIYLSWLFLRPKKATDGRRSNSLSGLVATLATLVVVALTDSLLGSPPNPAKYWTLLGGVLIFSGLYLTSHKQEKFFLWVVKILLAFRGKQYEEGQRGEES